MAKHILYTQKILSQYLNRVRSYGLKGGLETPCGKSAIFNWISTDFKSFFPLYEGLFLLKQCPPERGHFFQGLITMLIVYTQVCATLACIIHVVFVQLWPSSYMYIVKKKM